MTGKNGEKDAKDMHKAVELREQRRTLWEREGERSLWQNMSMIGALGWLIIVPTLLGVFVGRWLDGLFGTNIQLTGACLFLGVAFGCYLAWQRVGKE
ncbi:AtpZ/AtpI family protein [Kordiimonas marina]|uniref:AtpZ/AtpI family protein n=1 Tax=Kordiimonas marina TaxID=2872312 RepID=UPI001FF14BE5|nr:AtpZ/AtpI family protein [Kordiimonas marina]MCJ9428824.1 AtpZ/AtpI family protein [Kordiimonas marina]